ncbi:translation initiation factor eIF 4e-like domain-containing protein [Mycena sp. CBHHK59/15]|nr:translation initiation factor eIF 4e-like domain-containing protein [Mycena sp. CBHHK59/15]
MSYFSNHSSQSRFLAISANAAPTAPTSNPHSVHAPATRARSTSKHFSTSVAAAAADEPKAKDSEDDVRDAVHPLRNTWVFWFRQQRAPGNKIISYEEGIKRVAAFSSVESFWALQTHLAPPSLLTPTTDYLLFHVGVARPVWEDPLNITGGKWIIRLRKGVADRVWESLLCAVVGDMFAECRAPGVPGSWEDGSDGGGREDGAEGDGGGGVGDGWPEICGCTISVRQSEDIISLWNRVDQDQHVRERIRDTLRQVLNIPATTIMEYKSNNDSMQDKSSFRNSAIDRTPLA